MPSFQIASHLRASPERLWSQATNLDAVNHELGPLLRMTYPPGMGALADRTPPFGVPLFRSYFLLFGVVPVDYSDLAFESLDPGRGFRERSRMLSQREWIHERTIEPADGGTTLTDRITFTPRIPGTGALVAPILHLVFRNRHRRLVGLFGGEAGELRVI
jgi:hypothetical protein